MIVFRWILLLVALPFIAAAPAPVINERGIVDAAVTVLQGFLQTLLAGVSAVFTGTGTFFTTSTYITPATGGGKRIKVTGGRWIGYNSFLGIPFAEAPAGTKRFDKPQPKVYNGDITALKFGPACMQTLPIADGATGQSEDCLSLNILTPEGVAGTNAKLPVMVWIYGGGFFVGAGSYYTAFQAAVLNYAKQVNKPVIHVSLNYRLGIWGFGLGKEMAAAGAANLGLYDQKLAIQWVRENIAAFGGDPDQITLYGESAGAISTAIHLLDKQNEGVIKGAIMQSGTQSTVPIPRTEDYQQPYDDLVAIAGCSGAANNTLDCLRGLPAAALLAASFKLGLDKKYTAGLIPIVWRPSIDGDIIPDSPYKLLSEGKMANIPFITGTNKDEGTLFVDWFIQKQDDIPNMVNKLYPKPIPADAYTKMFAAYPNDPALGSPFNTGSNTFGLTPAYKQVAAIANDAIFLARKRNYLRKANQFGNSKTWTYLFEGPTPIVPGFLGVMHALDVPYMYGIVSPWIPLVGWRFQDQKMSQQMIEYWLNFAYKQDPNSGNLPAWPAHNFPANKNCMHFLPGSVGAIQDDFREDRVAVFDDPALVSVMFV